jgi:hypothetical protein
MLGFGFKQGNGATRSHAARRPLLLLLLLLAACHQPQFKPRWAAGQSFKMNAEKRLNNWPCLLSP